METYTKPTVQNYSEDSSTGTVDIRLSAVQDSGLIVVVEGNQKVPLYDDAFLILGPDGENPEWKGARQSLIDTTDPEDPKPKTANTEMTLPKKALEDYVGKEVQLRYQTFGESESYRYSKPITLKVQP